jgi:WD40 repeat protein/uncharacterized caspase-like protein
VGIIPAFINVHLTSLRKFPLSLRTSKAMHQLSKYFSVVKLFLVFVSTILAITASGQKPELVIQKGHLSYITTAVISPDGKLILTASADHTAKLWDRASGREIRTFSGHLGAVNDAVFSPDMKFVATTSEDLNSKLWDVKTGKLVFTFKKPLNTIMGRDTFYISNRVNGIVFTPDGKRVIIRASSGAAFVNDVATGRVIDKISTNYGDNRPSVSPDGEWFTMPNVYDAAIWDVKTFRKTTLREFESSIQAVNWSADSKYLIYSMYDGAVHILDIEYQKVIASVRQEKPMLDAKLLPDGSSLITLCEDGTLRLYGPNPKKASRPLLMKEYRGSERGLSAKSFSLDNSGKILTIADGSQVIVLAVDSLKELTRIEGKGKVASVKSVTVSGEGNELAACTGGRIHVWDLVAARQKFSFLTNVFVMKCFYAPDGKTLVTVNYDGSVVFWDPATGAKIKTFKKGDPFLTDAVFSGDGATMLTCGKGNEVTMWDVASGNPLRTFSASVPKPAKANHDKEQINAIALSRDGLQLAGASSDSVIFIWDVKTGQLTKTLRQWFGAYIKQTTALTFSADGKYLITGEEGGQVSGWDINAGETTWGHLDHSSRITALSLSEDGKYLYATSLDQTFYRWNHEKENANNIYPTDKFSAHTGPVFSLDLFPNQKFLATGSEDGTVKLWNVDSAKVIATMVSIGENDFAAIDANSNYTASKYASKGISFNVNNQVYPFQQFDLKMNRPDLVIRSMAKLGWSAEKLANSYNLAYHKRLRKLGLDEKQLNTEIHLPELKITSAIPFTTKESLFSFDIEASDSKYKLDKLRIVVNEVPLKGSAGIGLADDHANQIKKEITLELGYGKNSVEVTVVNEHGHESLVQSFVITNQATPAKPDLYIVAIGVSDYNDNDYDLTYAAKDANDLANSMKQNASHYANVKVLTITDKEAIKDNILKAKSFLMQSKVNDVVILAVAGHGLLDDNLDYYFGTSDVNFAHPETTGIAYDDLEGLLDGIPSRQKLMLIDACHSGEVDKEETEILASVKTNDGEVKSRGMKNVKKKTSLGLDNSFDLMRELFADLRKTSGAIVISSASGTEFAFESSEWQNGVFTYAVLEGIKSSNADLNKDTHITVSELRDYVVKKVFEMTNGRQTPTSRKENLEFDFNVW